MRKKYKGKSDKEIGEVLNGMLAKQDQLSRGFRTFDISKIWKETMGEMISNHTLNIHLSGDILYVELDSAALKQELSYRKDGIISKLNPHLKYNQIKKIVVK